MLAGIVLLAFIVGLTVSYYLYLHHNLGAKSINKF